jgi:hypothetical protein
VEEVDLREHWENEHCEELRKIDKWLGKVEDKVKSWERWKREVETGQVGDRVK